MKKRNLILGIMLLVSTVLIAAWLIIMFGGWVSSLDKSVLGPLLAALVGLTGILVTQWSSKSREIAESHRESKVKVYDLFFDIIEMFLYESDRDEKVMVDGELSPVAKRLFAEFSRGLLIWGSPGVIEAWLSYKKITSNSPTTPEIMLSVDRMLKEIRKDLGNKNFGLHQGDLVRIYLKDPGELQS
ncbi:MAG: hypothetical protein VX793_08835 [Pseudomonadota bacterium]|nr:hypothetical protein [Pseudomonadota bacterium]